MSETNEAIALFHQGMTLFGQGIAILEHVAGKKMPVFSARELARIARVGEIAHLHLTALETSGELTLAESREIRRQHGGAKMRSTANLFGRKASGAILYRLVDYGTKPGGRQQVRLTSEGERIAKAYRTLYGVD